MFTSSLSRKPAALARTAAVTGAALAALAFSAGTAGASAIAAERPAAPRGGAVEEIPGHVASRVCTELEAIVAQLPVPSAPAQVCKLVNGWD